MSLHMFVRRELIGGRVELTVSCCLWIKFELVVRRPACDFLAPVESGKSHMVARIKGDFQVIPLAIALRIEQILIQVTKE